MGLLLAVAGSSPFISQSQGPGVGAVPEIYNVSRPALKSVRLATGVTLQYAEQGSTNGIPVIFLHGITDSWHSFETNLPYLPAHIRAFAITQRGHGDSEHPEQGYKMTDFAADVAAFIRHHGLGPSFIVGHSMGGVVAQQFALDFPEMLRGLVLVDTDPAFVKNQGMPEFLKEVLAMKGRIDRPYMVAFQQSTLAKPIDSAYFETVVNEGVKTPVRVFQQALRTMLETDFSNDLARISAPVLVLWGEKDIICLRPGQELLIEKIPNLQFIPYRNTGHALHWEVPRRFADDLTAFVENIVLKENKN